MNQIDWSQMVAMIAVLGAISGGIQWVINRSILQPALIKQVEEIKKWAVAELISKGEFQLHLQDNENHHDRLTELLANIVADQDVDNKRLADLHDKVIMIQARRS